MRLRPSKSICMLLAFPEPCCLWGCIPGSGIPQKIDAGGTWLKTEGMGFGVR